MIEDTTTNTRGHLNAGVVTVVFTKKDGTQRTMRCTTNLALIPQDRHPKPIAETVLDAPDATTQRAFDLDLGEWRSFKHDSVISVSTLTNESE